MEFEISEVNSVSLYPTKFQEIDQEWSNLRFVVINATKTNGEKIIIQGIYNKLMYEVGYID